MHELLSIFEGSKSKGGLALPGLDAEKESLCFFHTQKKDLNFLLTPQKPRVTPSSILIL